MIIKTVYLAGPIQGCEDSESKLWRQEFKKEWPYLSLDPMRRDYRSTDLSDDECARVVEQDIEDINQCDALVANLSRISVGTSMEVFYAANLGGKYVYLIYDRPIRELSPWMRYHATEIFVNVQDCIAWMMRHNRMERTKNG